MRVLRPAIWKCDECNAPSETLVMVGCANDYATICQDCLAKAFQMLKDAEGEK